MNKINKYDQRNLQIDALKGLAIIAIALYHFGGGVFFDTDI